MSGGRLYAGDGCVCVAGVLAGGHKCEYMGVAVHVVATVRWLSVASVEAARTCAMAFCPLGFVVPHGLSKVGVGRSGSTRIRATGWTWVVRSSRRDA